MMNAQEPVDVAVIDEIQMISDADRGWAWTAALVGAPARDVFVCGAVAAKKVCEEVAATLGEEMTIEMLTRKNELQAVQMKKEATSNSKGKSTGRDFKIERGDALIAFSRKDVLTLSARYRNKGFKVSTIYGALAPEVRRAEAQRFADGESDLVVATDAVGMGLNLPVRRIVFSTVHKFDGEQVRTLNAPELQQIAGRAGRFGMHEKGIVTAMDQEDFAVVQMRLGESVPALTLPLGIAPNLEHIKALAQMLKTQKIGAILAFFANKISMDSKTYKTSKMETSVSLGHRVDTLLKSSKQELGLREKFIFACAPVSSNNMDEQYYFDDCLIDHACGRECKLPEIPEWVHSNDYRYLDAAEDLNKRYTLYAWLSFKFPETFVDFEQVHPLRSEINAYIEKALVRQGGFGVTSKEAFKQRSRDR
jgi:replicative superfamily II helicase